MFLMLISMVPTSVLGREDRRQGGKECAEFKNLTWTSQLLKVNVVGGEEIRNLRIRCGQ